MSCPEVLQIWPPSEQTFLEGLCFNSPRCPRRPRCATLLLAGAHRWLTLKMNVTSGHFDALAGGVNARWLATLLSATKTHRKYNLFFWCFPERKYALEHLPNLFHQYPLITVFNEGALDQGFSKWGPRTPWWSVTHSQGVHEILSPSLTKALFFFYPSSPLHYLLLQLSFFIYIKVVIFLFVFNRVHLEKKCLEHFCLFVKFMFLFFKVADSELAACLMNLTFSNQRLTCYN